MSKQKLFLTLAVVLLLAVGIGVKFADVNKEPKKAVEIAQAQITLTDQCSTYNLDACADGPAYGDVEGIARVEMLEQELHNMHVRQDHPRIFLTQENRDAYRARAQSHRSWSKVLAKANNASLNLPERALNAAFVYQMTGNTSYADIAIQAMIQADSATWGSPPIFEGISIHPQTALISVAFDWTYETMSEADRDFLIGKIATLASMEQGRNRAIGETFHVEEWIGHTWRAWPEIALAHHHPKAESHYLKRWNYDWYWGDGARFMAYVADGTPPEGYYCGVNDGWSWFMALKTSTGVDVMYDARFPYLDESSYYHLYRLDFNRERMVFKPGSDFIVGGTANYKLWSKGSMFWTQTLRFSDSPYTQWAADIVGKNQAPFDYLGAPKEIYAIWDILYYNPELPKKDPKTATWNELPLSRYFPGGNHVYMRTGWGNDETLAGFRASEVYTINSHWHFLVNDFHLYRRGIISSVTGFYGWGADPNRAGYHSTSTAQNMLLVDPDPTVPETPNPSFPGQTKAEPIGTTSGQFGSLGPKAVFLHTPEVHWGDIVKFRNDPEYDYAVGDAARAYGDRLHEYLRNVLFLRKGDKAYFIVFDRVESAQPQYLKRWLMHFVSEPQVNGNDITNQVPINIPYYSEKVPGHIDYWDGDLTYAENAFGTASVNVKTLLPQQHTIKRIGGGDLSGPDSYRFWRAGQNWDIISQESLDAFFSVFDGPYEELGTWRIEITPNNPATRDYFLNVMYIGDAGESMPALQLVEEGDQVGVIINDPELSKNKIMFTKTGEPDVVVSQDSGALFIIDDYASLNPANLAIDEIPVNSVTVGTAPGHNSSQALQINFVRPPQGFLGLGWSTYTQSHAYIEATNNSLPNLSAYTGLGFWVKGNGEKEYGAVALRTGSNDYVAYFYLNNTNWQYVQIPWEHFHQINHAADVPLNLAQVQNIYFGTPYYWPNGSYVIDDLSVQDFTVFNPGLTPGPDSAYNLTNVKTMMTNKQKVNIVTLGDSITYGDQSTVNFTELLLTSLQQEYNYNTDFIRASAFEQLTTGEIITGVNSGIPRDCAVHGLTRLGGNGLGYNPNLFTIYFGVNDHNYGFSPERYGKALEQIIREIRDKTNPDAEIIIIPPTPVHFNLNTIAPYETVAKNIAQQANIPIADINQVLRNDQANIATYFAPDEVHLNEKGHQTIASLLFDQLKYTNPATEHPRLLFKEQDILALQGKVHSGEAKRLWDILKPKADSYLSLDPSRVREYAQGSGIPLAGYIRELAFAYILSGDTRYGQKAVDLIYAWSTDRVAEYPYYPYADGLYHTIGDILTAVALGYDWTYNLMDDQTQKAVEAALTELAFGEYTNSLTYYWGIGQPYNNWTGTKIGGYGLAGLAVAGATGKTSVEENNLINRARDVVAEYLAYNFGVDGEAYEGIFYGGYGLRNAVLFAETLKQNRGADIFTNSNAARHIDHLIYALLPADRNFIQLNNANSGTWTTYASYMISQNNGSAKWLWDNYSDIFGSRTELDTAILFYDSTLASTSPSTPLVKNFQAPTGITYFRTGWQADDIVSSFDAKEMRIIQNGAKTLSTFHLHEDVTAFTLYGYGAKFAIPPGYDFNGSIHTQAHNNILIDGLGQTSNKKGDELFFIDNDWLSLAAASAQPSYPSTQKADRYYAMLNKSGNPYFISIDDIQKDSGQHNYEWLLQTDADNTINIAANQAEITAPNGSVLGLNFISQTPLNITADAQIYQYSTGYAKRLRAAAVAINPYFLAIMTPKDSGMSSPEIVELATDTTSAAQITWDNSINYALIKKGDTLSGFNISSNARAVFLKDNTNFAMLGGTNLQRQGILLADTYGVQANVTASQDEVIVQGAGVTHLRIYAPQASSLILNDKHLGIERDPEDPDYVVLEGLPEQVPPVITQVQTGTVTNDSAAITWTTDEPATSQIEYGETTSYGKSTTFNSNLTTSHSADISGLTGNTLYHYRIVSKDKWGNEAKSGDYTFKTLLLPGQQIITYQEGVSGQPYDRCDDAFILSSNTAYNSQGRDLQIMAGDQRIVIGFPDIIGNNPNQIPLGSEILSAELNLATGKASNSELRAYRILKSWNENQVTWNTASSGNPWNTPGVEAIGLDREGIHLGQAVVIPSSGVANFDIKDAVQSWANGEENGGVLIIQSEPADYIVFAASEHTYPSPPTVRPKLKVDFVAAQAPKPEITLSKTANVAEAKTGDTIIYTITYNNIGTADALNVIITDPIPDGATYVQNSARFVSGQTGIIDQSTPTITWTIASAPAGQGGSVEMRVMVAE